MEANPTRIVASGTTGATLELVPRPRYLLTLLAIFVSIPSLAAAETFRGFGQGGDFQRGESLCSPIATSAGTPQCHKATGAESFSKGRLQAGSEQIVLAKSKGTKLLLLSKEDGSTLFSWDSGEMLNSVGKVYLDASGRYVAVEYTYRLGGRIVERQVVLTLKTSLGSSSATTPAAKSPAVSTSPKPIVPKVVLPPLYRKSMKEGIKWAARRKHTKAIPHFAEALRVIPNSPEALYRLARSHYAAKDLGAAKKSLKDLGADKTQEGAKWRVEARFDRVFKKLRSDSDFRKAVGIDRAPGEKVSTYERLVALGGKWEQESLPCEQPQVNLSLLRNKKRRFDLVFRSKCQGTTETTRLDGSWLASSAGLELRFPNMGANDDSLICRLERCSDSSGEDCLRCKPEPDLEFLLRVVRR